MNRPILIIVIGYIIGIIWGLYLQVSIVFLYVFLLIIYLLINIQYKKKEFKMLSIKRHFRYLKIIFKINILIIIILSSLVSNTIIKYQNKKYNNLYKNIKEIEIIGIVVSNKEEKEYYNKYKIKVYDGKLKNTYLYVNTIQELNYGDKIKLSGEYIEPETARNYKGFNYKEYLKTLKIYGTIKVEKIEIQKSKYIESISNNIYLKIKSNIQKTYNEKTQGIILGVLFGDTGKIENDIKDQFSKSNISHVLAVSGIHISYIIYLVTNTTQGILGKRKSKIIATIVLITYMFITNFSISVVRACVMGIISCMSIVFYRKSDTINNIAISAIIILIYNPFSINNLSFLLTYGGTIGIVIFNNIIEKFIKNIKIKKRKWKYIFIKIQRKSETLIKILSVSISAQIIIIPIIILNFNNIGISFLITNLLLNLVIGPIIMVGLIQALISLISIKIGLILGKILQIPIYILIFISKIGSKIPFGNFKIITPDFYQILIYYFLIFLLRYIYIIFNNKNARSTQLRIKNMIYLVKYKTRKYRKTIKYVIITILILFIVINQLPGKLKIYFIDVQQGDSTLIITQKKKTILIDGGGSKTYNIGKNILIPYLLDRKIKKIDYIIISHFDIDHVRSDY